MTVETDFHFHSTYIDPVSLGRPWHARDLTSIFSPVKWGSWTDLKGPFQQTLTYDQGCPINKNTEALRIF